MPLHHSFNRREFLKLSGLYGAAIAFDVNSGKIPATDKKHRQQKTKRPNILLIMADDMGYSDIGCYGSEINTPNLDKLAHGGLRFTQFYNAARCCPTRASLMTGLYSHQTGIGHMVGDKGLPGYTGKLNNKNVTIAEVLKRAGYSTYMVGKWHLTRQIKPQGPKHDWPCQRGFDRLFGTIRGAGSFYDPSTLIRDNTMITPPSEDFYYTDAISDNAVKYIAEHKRDKDDDTPFFLYAAYTAPHWPMHAREGDIAKYKGQYKKGWHKLRRERYKKLKKMGIINENWQISPDDSPDWKNLKEKDRKWHERLMEVYAAMVTVMDEGIGRIIDELEKQDELDNTLIFFLQDNGGCAETLGMKGEVRPYHKDAPKLGPMSPGQLQRNMVPKVTRDGKPVMIGHGVMPGPPDTYIAYGREWANVSNTPFRLYKHWDHEGGISTPLIVHWPNGINSKGMLRQQIGHLIDIMPTCVDVSDAVYPKVYKGHKIQPMEGVSLVPAFNNEKLERQAPIFWEHEGNRAIRDGDWKLVAKGPTGNWQLYNMAQDRTEMNDLADKYPERTQKMIKMWENWAERANVIPWIWEGKYSPANYSK